MATEAIIRMTDDLDGATIEEGQGRTLQLGLDGATYELDLTNEHIEELTNTLERYVAAARVVSATKFHRTQRAHLEKVRAWAAKNGMEVSARGRIGQDVIDAYEAAQH